MASACFVLKYFSCSSHRDCGKSQSKQIRHPPFRLGLRAQPLIIPLQHRPYNHTANDANDRKRHHQQHRHDVAQPIPRPKEIRTPDITQLRQQINCRSRTGTLLQHLVQRRRRLAKHHRIRRKAARNIQKRREVARSDIQRADGDGEADDGDEHGDGDVEAALAAAVAGVGGEEREQRADQVRRRGQEQCHGVGAQAEALHHGRVEVVEAVRRVVAARHEHEDPGQGHARPR